MTTKPKTTTKSKQKKSATQMESIERMYGKDFGIESDKEIKKYYKGKKYKALRGLILRND